jgi:periplasmic protein TonB
MKTELIMKSDILDIIFENRNKAYGAYYLRKFYSNRVFKSLAYTLTGVIVLSAFTLIPEKKNYRVNDDMETILSQIAPELKEKPKEPEKIKEQPKPKPPTVTYNIPVIVKNVDSIKPLIEITDTTAIANTTDPGEPGVKATVGGPVEGGEGGPKEGGEPAVTQVDKITPTETAEQMPEFPGGIDALRRFLQRNLTNPKELEENETVSVKVRFVVGYDGKLKSFETVQDGGEEFNKEVMRVLKKMPEWVPGKTKGQNVSVYYTIPVKFVPEN